MPEQSATVSRTVVAHRASGSAGLIAGRLFSSFETNDSDVQSIEKLANSRGRLRPLVVSSVSADRTFGVLGQSHDNLSTVRE